MSVPNPYSDVRLPGKPYFANEAFEDDQSSGSTADPKATFPGNFPQPGAADSAQHNGAARGPAASLANPYGSIYRSPPAGGGSKEPGVSEAESWAWACRCCPCCRCRCCPSCVLC